MLLTVQEQEERQALTEYICRAYKIDTITGLMNRQIEQYMREYKYKLRGMLMTLEYCFVYKEPRMQPVVHYGLGLIPVYYDEAKDFYKSRLELAKRLRSMDIEHISNLSRTVNINQSDRPERAQKRMIEIESLEVDD